jgi:hypothetical protein
MFYSRFILAVLSLFAIILPILAAPVVTEAPAVNGTDVSETHLEKRITHNGKVIDQCLIVPLFYV